MEKSYIYDVETSSFHSPFDINDKISNRSKLNTWRLF